MLKEMGMLLWVIRRLQKVANAIIKTIKKTLVAFMNIVTNLGLVMQKVMVAPIVRDVIPNLINMVKDAFKCKES